MLMIPDKNQFIINLNLNYFNYFNYPNGTIIIVENIIQNVFVIILIDSYYEDYVVAMFVLIVVIGLLLKVKISDCSKNY